MTTNQAPFFLMNAAGTAKTLDDVTALCKVPDIRAIVVGSITIKTRHGNDGNTYRATPAGSLNSIGMKNPGLDVYKNTLPTMVGLAHAQGKLLGVSVAGIDSVKEYAELTAAAFEAGADLVEENGGCPNVWAHGRQHRILTFDLEGMRVMLDEVESVTPLGKRVYIKVSPCSDPMYLKELSELFNSYPFITGVTAINTFPNGFGRDENGDNLISVGKGLAGVSGLSLKLIGPGQVLQYREHLSAEKEIIATGGINCGQDLLDYAACGATYFQIGTALWDRGPSVFGEVLADAMILREKQLIEAEV